MAPERLLTRAFVLVWIANLTQGMSFSLFIHFPGFLQDLGADELEIGLIFGISALAAVIIRPTAGRTMDLRGRKVVITSGNMLNAGTLALYLTVTSIGPWVYTVRVVHGLAEAVLFTAYFTYAADLVPAERRTQGLALFGVSGMLTIALGGLVGDAILSVWDFDALFLTAVGFALASLAVSLPLPEQRPGIDAAPPRRFLTSLRQKDLLPLWWLAATFSIVVTSYFTFLKTFVLETEIGTVGLFFAAYSIVAVLLRILGSWVPDKVGLKRILFPALTSMAIGLVVLAFASAAWEVAVAGVLCGAGHGYAFPIMYGLVVSRARPAERGVAMSVFTGLFDVALLVGGPVLGAVIRYGGYREMFLFAAGLMVIGVAVFWVWDRERDAVLPGGFAPLHRRVVRGFRRV